MRIEISYNDTFCQKNICDMPHTHSPLGTSVTYPSQYDPSLLFPIARQTKREELDITGTLPFFGVDIWNAYELSWLNPRGKPQIALATFTVPADSPYLVESKSFKLYLNSFNQTKLDHPDLLKERLRADLSTCTGAPVHITLTHPSDFSEQRIETLPGLLLDRLDIDVTRYTHSPDFLSAEHTQAPVEETLISHLLKSNCLITGQPDWASVQIHYIGAPIDQAGLLRYLISFREHHEFHEQCVERMFMDILRRCAPQKLSVYARYTRRGGLDINPWRSNFTTAHPPTNQRHARQ